MSAHKTDPVARQIVAMLIRRKRDAKRYWLRAQRTGIPQEILTLLDAYYCEAYNASEAARRMLYA